MPAETNFTFRPTPDFSRVGADDLEQAVRAHENWVNLCKDQPTDRLIDSIAATKDFLRSTAAVVIERYVVEYHVGDAMFCNLLLALGTSIGDVEDGNAINLLKLPTDLLEKVYLELPNEHQVVLRAEADAAFEKAVADRSAGFSVVTSV